MDVESARHEWKEANRRLEKHASDVRRYRQLVAQVEAVTEELRRRVGATFTLDELVSAYEEAERWSRAVVSERASAPSWPTTLSIVEGAAFHAYQRGAADYRP